MDTTTQDQATQIFGYDVIDGSGNNVGSVDGVWVDDATDALEFVSIKTGWLMGKTHLIPMENAQVDDANNQIQVPYGEDQIKDAPSFATDAELSPDDEQSIYSYYGMQRSDQASPTGLGTGYTFGTTNYVADSGPDAGVVASEYDTDTDLNTADTVTADQEIDVPLSEEQLQVGKRQVEAGQVRLRKVVRTETVEQPVELRREEVEIDRVPVSDTDTVPTDAFQEREINVPVMREEAVVAKEAQVTGRVVVGKDVETETQTVGGEVRREDVEIDRDDTDVAGNAYADREIVSEETDTTNLT
jgi:uncharacterized protein (TIGR02271 family)